MTDDLTHLAHFRILGRLGEGGMGVVYRAEDESLRRTVALKILPDTARDEERTQRFLREARSAAAITHPNVAVIHQVGEDDGRIYIAMELVEGESLRSRLERGRLDPKTARDLALQIARGLSAAHEKGIVHRDLKPENVMITPDGVVKLLDFGLAKQGVDRAASSGDVTAGLARTETLVTSDEGRILGTPHYMSPEQALGEPLDVRSDVFSLGIVLYELFSGARPFGGPSAPVALIAIVRDPPTPLRERAPEVDAATDVIVMRCLAKAPADRFASAGEVMMAFSGRVSPRATTASRVDVAPVTRTDDARLPPRRRRTVAAVISVVAVALALGTVGLFWRAGTQSKEVHGALPSAGTSDARTRGRAITDHPPPRTKSPEAAAAYASALQDARDGSLAMASDELLRASKLDPTFAAASLRIVLLTRGGDLTEAREAFAAASRSRGSLDERDLLLLHAAEAQTGDPVDWSELAARLEATLDRFPDDAETLWHLGCAQEKVHDIAAARASEDRALMVDPQFAGALWAIGRMYMDVEEYDQGLPVLERCLEVSPSAASCLRVRSVIHRERGQCADFEADARRMTVVEPRGVKAYEYLASAIATRGAPLESVHAALDKAVSLQAEIDSAQAAVDRKTNELLLGALTGDIPSAASAARELDRLATDRTTESEHASSALALIDIFEEQGQPAKALAVAEDFERKLPAWTADAPLVIRSYLLYARHHAGLADDSFKRMREALLRETLRGVAPLDAPTLTFRLYSLWAKTPDEVADALTFVGALPPGLSEPEALASVGKMYFLAGQPDEAIPPLRRAAASCELLSRYVPLFHDQRVHVLLGEALEAKGEKEGACEAYRVVLDLWKDAKGRSITLEKAKERSRALRCGH